MVLNTRGKIHLLVMSVKTRAQNAVRNQIPDEWIALADARNELITEHGHGPVMNKAVQRVEASRIGPYLEPKESDGRVVATLKRDLKVMVVGIIFIAIGVLLVSEIDQALPAIDNTALSSDYETTLERFGTGITLAGLVLIILPAISILRRMDVI